MAGRILIRRAIMLVLLTAPIALNSQTPSSTPRTGGQVQKNSAESQNPTSVPEQNQVAMIAALPYLPDISPPHFEDPLGKERGYRMQSLMQEFAGSLQQKGEQVNPSSFY